MHPIAGTIIIEDVLGQVRFLANKTTKLFVTGQTSKDKTALASIIDELKLVVDIDFDQLELIELTNSVFEKENIPLYVFGYTGRIDDEYYSLIDDTDTYAWLNHKELKTTFEQLNIEGVPNFK